MQFAVTFLFAAAVIVIIVVDVDVLFDIFPVTPLTTTMKFIINNSTARTTANVRKNALK
jgi:hypothetical protein